MNWLIEHGFEKKDASWRRSIGTIALILREDDAFWSCSIFDSKTGARFGCGGDTPEEAVKNALFKAKEDTSRLANILMAVESTLINNIKYDDQWKDLD